MLKKRYAIAMLLVACSVFMFTSCIEIVESLSYSNGQYNVSARIMVQKKFMLMSEITPEYVQEILGTEDDGNVNITVIETEKESGVLVRNSIKPEATSDKKMSSLLPKRKSGFVHIPLLTASAEEVDFSQDIETQMTAMFLDNAKYRILIGKNIVPSISVALLTTEVPAVPEISVPVYDEGNMYCIEIPLLTVLERDVPFKSIKLIP